MEQTHSEKDTKSVLFCIHITFNFVAFHSVCSRALYTVHISFSQRNTHTEPHFDLPPISNGFCFIPCARHTQPMWQIVNPIFGSRYKIEDEIQRNNTDTIDSFVQSRNQWFLQSQSKLCMLSGFLQCLSSSPPSRIKTQILPSKSRWVFVSFVCVEVPFCRVSVVSWPNIYTYTETQTFSHLSPFRQRTIHTARSFI